MFIPGESHFNLTFSIVFRHISSLSGNDPFSSSPVNSWEFVIGSGDSDVGSGESCSV